MPILLRTEKRARSVLKPSVETVVFDRLYIDTTTGNAIAYFSKYIGGIRQSEDLVFNVGPQVVAPILYARGDASKTRSADIAEAVYRLAVREGWFVGTIF